ncbi:ComEA family DNA-binding protein [Micrococcus endophyticus]
MGPATAEKIIAHRETVGPFTGLQDLDAVPGVGPAALERLRDRVTW